MRVTKVRKDELREKLEVNRSTHVETYERAFERYRDACQAWLTETLDKVKAGEQADMTFREPMPTNHSDDYDRALMKLEMSVDEEIEVDDDDFAQLVMDDWGWKRMWATTNAAYGVS